MSLRRFARLACWLEQLFPERRLYLRTGGQMRAIVLSPKRQLALAAGVAVAGLWMGVSTAALLVTALDPAGAAAAATRIDDRGAVAPRPGGGSLQALANSMEARHAALALLLTDLRSAPGAAQALLPVVDVEAPAGDTPQQRLALVERGQDRLVDAAAAFATRRADRLGLAFRLAGLDPAAYSSDGDSQGGPLIEDKDPGAVAAVLDVDDDFAAHLQHAVADVSDMQSLAASEAALPLGQPTRGAWESSGFGMRDDPFTGRPTFHPGEDFAGAYGSPVYATAPGVVSFTGVRDGYGDTIEVDHGHGFKTRYAHLSAISVAVGQHVAAGERIGAMGSTGRSTGDHLHYEVWVNGRPQNPLRFLKAGDYVQQTRF